MNGLTAGITRVRLSRCLVAFLVVIATGPVYSQQSATSVGLAVTTEGSIPIGSRASFYQFGVGARLESLLAITGLPYVSPQIDAAYTVVPLALGENAFFSTVNLSLLRAGLGAKSTFSLGDGFAVFLRGYGGGFFGSLLGSSAESAIGLAFGGGVGVTFLPTESLLLQLSAAYDSYVGLYDGLSVSLGATFRVSGPGALAVPRPGLGRAPETGPVEGYIRFRSIDLDRVFPSLYKYYNGHPIGRATIANEGNQAIEGLEVELALGQYMDAPKVSARIDRLEPGEEQEVDIYALFTEDVLSITEGALVAAELTTSYQVGERRGSDSEVVTLSTYDRNALQWDDDRKIAAFVTARDEEIQRFARNVASVARRSEIEVFGDEFQNAVALLSALDVHGMAYTIDPNSAYEVLSANPFAVDSVQFPRQTLEFRAGDCDDLSATYAALLEAVGVQTAFLTIPGHIFMAFRVQGSSAQVARAFPNPDDLIFRDDSVWIPVETTILDQGFLQAWSVGAQQWRDSGPAGEFISTSESWLTYEPVAFGVSGYSVDIPSPDDVQTSYLAEIERIVNREISTQESPLLERIEARPGDFRARNRLGVIYARYGRHDQARAQFERVVELQEYPPALVNLGNVTFLSGDLESARRYYESAVDLDPANGVAILGLAKVNFADQRFSEASGAHSRLQTIAPDLAEQFSYLAGPSIASGDSAGDGGRASDAARQARAVVWGE